MAQGLRNIEAQAAAQVRYLKLSDHGAEAPSLSYTARNSSRSTSRSTSAQDGYGSHVAHVREEVAGLVLNSVFDCVGSFRFDVVLRQRGNEDQTEQGRTQNEKEKHCVAPVLRGGKRVTPRCGRAAGSGGTDQNVGKFCFLIKKPFCQISKGKTCKHYVNIMFTCFTFENLAKKGVHNEE